MTARQRAEIRWGMALPKAPQRVLYVHHERGCHGKKRGNRTCACWRKALTFLAAHPDVILSDGTRGGIS